MRDRLAALLVVAVLVAGLGAVGSAVGVSDDGGPTDRIDIESLRDRCENESRTDLVKGLTDALEDEGVDGHPGRFAELVLERLFDPPAPASDDLVAIERADGGYWLEYANGTVERVAGGNASPITYEDREGTHTLTYEEYWVALEWLDGSCPGADAGGTETTTTAAEDTTTATEDTTTATERTTTESGSTTGGEDASPGTTRTTTCHEQHGGGETRVGTTTQGSTTESRTTTESVGGENGDGTETGGGSETTTDSAVAGDTGGDGGEEGVSEESGWGLLGDLSSLLLTIAGAFVSGVGWLVTVALASVAWWVVPIVKAILGYEVDKLNLGLAVGGALLTVLATVVALVAGATLGTVAAVVLILTLPITLIYLVYNYWDDLVYYYEEFTRWLGKKLYEGYEATKKALEETVKEVEETAKEADKAVDKATKEWTDGDDGSDEFERASKEADEAGEHLKNGEIGEAVEDGYDAVGDAGAGIIDHAVEWWNSD